MNRHRLAESRSLALHRAIGELLDEDPSILERARARVRHWLSTSGVNAFWAEKWEALLSGSNQEIREALSDESEEARALRQVTPFAGAIDPRMRWRIWREVRESWEEAP